MVKNRSVFRHVRDGELVEWLYIFVLSVNFEVLGDVGVFLAELFELFLGERFVETTLS